MKAKKVIALVMCAAMVAGMSASSVMAADMPEQFKDLKANEAYDFPMMVKSFQSTYWDAAQEGMKKAADELGVTYKAQGPNSESDIADQVNMINTAIAAKPAGLGLAACDTSSVLDALQECVDKGIPVVTFDTGIADAPEGSVVCEVCTDNAQAGSVAAENMYNAIKDVVANADGQVIIGEVNQDLKYAGEPTRVEIGDRNRIRESVTIHRGTVQGGGLTKVGSDNLLMINAHVAHDCTVGNRCILANNATLAGHVSLDDFVIIGGMTAVHQFCIIGAHVMVGGCSGVAQDVPPFVIAQGNHATPYGVNIEGLKRRGFSREAITAIRNAYKLLYRSGKTLDEAKPEIAELATQYPEVQPFVDFFARSTRGLIR